MIKPIQNKTCSAVGELACERDMSSVKLLVITRIVISVIYNQVT